MNERKPAQTREEAIDQTAREWLETVRQSGNVDYSFDDARRRVAKANRQGDRKRDVVLSSKASQWLRLDPGGASRNVDLPGVAEGLEDSDGAWFMVLNTANAAEDLTVRDPAGATVATVSQNQRALFVGTGGETWAHMGIETIALS